MSKKRSQGRKIVGSVRRSNRRAGRQSKSFNELVLEDLSILDSLVEQHIDSRIKIVGESNVLTFTDGYFQNLKQFAH